MATRKNARAAAAAGAKRRTSRPAILLTLVVLTIVSIAVLSRLKAVPPSYGPAPIAGNPNSSLSTDLRAVAKALRFQRAPELVSPQGHVNAKNVTVGENIGKKVVLIDFWTYSCINCLRTIPFLNA